MLFGYKVFGLIPNLAKSQFASLAKWLSVRLWTKWLWVRVYLQSLEKEYVKFRFCFNKRLKCSVVMWFQFNQNITLDLP